MTKALIEHMKETKKLVTDLANKIMLTDEDFEDDTRFAASLVKKVENIIIGDHLVNLSNERIEEANNLFGENNVPQSYVDDMYSFIQELYRRML